MVSIMDNFDPLAMPYIHSPLPYGNGLPNLDYMSVPPPLDLQDQYSNFDSETYLSGDDLSFQPSTGLQHPAMLKRYSSGFDDPFAESTLAQYDRMPAESLPDSPSIDRDSKYLSFGMPQYNFTLLDESFRRSSVNINAQLHGMFFLAESQWPATPDTPAPPPELTCYRRNLFQITGNITLPRNLRYVFTDDGSRIPIYELELAVSATESVEGNAVKIISVPWKTPTTGDATAKADDKGEREPPTIALDKMAGQDMDSDFTTFPIQWKRLQFRVATANNGRRKELQQHFTLHLKVMASLSTGGKISIAEVNSGAVIVRGRSPRNFAARKDLPLSSSTSSRKHIPALNRAGSSQTSLPQASGAAPTSAPRIKSPPEEASPQLSIPFENVPGLRAESQDLNGWSPGMAVTPPLPNPNFTASLGAPSMSAIVSEPSPDFQTPYPFTFAAEIPHTNGPISLHVDSGDEGSPMPQQQSSRNSSRAPTSNLSPHLMQLNRAPSFSSTMGPDQISDMHNQRPRMQSRQSIPGMPPSLPSNSSMNTLLTTSVPTPPVVQQTINTKTGRPYTPEIDQADAHYEYFPLGLEDWMPPVDAVFRPHVVHHSGPHVADPRSPSGRNSKRYFSEVA